MSSRRCCCSSCRRTSYSSWARESCAAAARARTRRCGSSPVGAARGRAAPGQGEPGEKLGTVGFEQQARPRTQRSDVLEGGLVLEIPLRQHLEALRLPVVAVRLAQSRDQLTALKLAPGVELQHLQPLLGERVLELQPAAEHRYRQAAARQSLVVAPRMRRIDDVVVVRVADTAEGAHAQADAARAERI